MLCEAVYTVPDDAGWQRLAETLDPDEDDEDLLVLIGREVADDEYLNRGTVVRDADRWTVTPNSRERMTELKNLVLAGAPDAVLLTDSAQPAADAMAQQRGTGDEAARSPFGVDDEFDLSPDRQIALMDEYMTRHERRWCDEQVPALGGISPREAFVAGGGARAELEAMLDYMAWMRRQNGGGMDADRIRDLLERPAHRRVAA